MRTLLSIVILALSACSLDSRPAAPLEYSVEINYLADTKGCDAVFWDAQTYLQGLGILLVKSPSGYTFLCTEGRFLAWLLPGIDGITGEKSGYFRMAASRLHSTKRFLHELGHAMGASHSLTGIMTPISELQYLATGYSQQTIQEIL